MNYRFCKGLWLLLLSSIFVFKANGTLSDPRVTKTVKAVSWVMPSVVNISTERIVKNNVTETDFRNFEDIDNFLPFANISSQPHEKREFSLGSGCIINEKGLILTNAHVVKSASRISITLYNGAKYSAKLLFSNDLNDVALIQIINPGEQQFQPIKFAVPADLILGEPVIAVGNPLGLRSTISQGILSAIGRELRHEDRVVFKDLLQTDAAVHEGHSGGPLVNIKGEMIGITTAVRKGTYGIGFAVPLLRVENIIAEWLMPDQSRDISLGFVPGVRVDENNKISFYLQKVMPGTPAWNAGLRENQQIRSINDKVIESLIESCIELGAVNDGDSIKIKGTGNREYKFNALKIKLDDGNYIAGFRMGLGVQELNQRLAGILGVPDVDGLVVSDNSRPLLDIKRGDILIKIEDYSISSFDDLVIALREYPHGKEVSAVFIEVVRDAGNVTLKRKTVKIPLI